MKYLNRSGAALVAIFIASRVMAGGTLPDHNHAELHAEKGIASSELFPGYAALCDLSMVFRNVNLPRKARTSASPSADRSEAPSTRQPRQNDAVETPPMRVFDNLYFLGSAGVSSWLLGTEEGYILIDAMNSNDDAENIIEAGMLELGLDPNKIQYLLITHGHGDHYGGHRYFREKYNLPLVMSEVDWELAGMIGEHPRFGPPPVKGESDLSAQQGDTLTAGTTTLDIHVTPGHTMGTISPVFTVYDQGKSYRAALWGGTGFNFGANADQLAAYATSAHNFKLNAEAENVEVFFSNHGRRDGSIEKMRELAERKPGDPHPFVLGERAREVYDVLEQCALAQYDRLTSGDYNEAAQ